MHPDVLGSSWKFTRIPTSKPYRPRGRLGISSFTSRIKLPSAHTLKIGKRWTIQDHDNGQKTSQSTREEG
jgi:hypothetical protein